MIPDDKIIAILSSSNIQAKYAVLEQLLVSKTSSRAIVEALEKATHDEDMGVSVRAIKALQAEAHHQKALELGLFGPVNRQALPEQTTETTGDQPDQPPAHPDLSLPISNQDVQQSYEASLQPRAVPIPSKEAEASLLPLAGGFRRAAAILIDLLILTIICLAIGLIFNSWLERLSFYSRILLGVIGFTYFGLFNSSLFSGATPGKRLLHLQVVDSHGHPIKILTSMLRSSILVFILLFFDWQVPGITTQSWGMILVNLFIFGMLSAILFLAVFNRLAGQSLDDLLVGSRVVSLRGSRVACYPLTPRLHLAGAIVLAVAVPLAYWAISQNLQGITATNTTTPQLQPLYQAINSDPRFYTAGLSEGYLHTPSQQLVKLLVISVWPRTYLSQADRQQITTEIASLARSDNALQSYSGLQIQLLGGYDLGLFDRSIIWLCAPPAGCSEKIVRDSILRYINFTSSYPIRQ